MSIAVVQGASGGIGRQLVSTLLKRTSFHIVAACRNPAAHQPNYDALTPEYKKRITTVPVDVTDESTISAAAEEVRSAFGDRCVRLLINANGILHAEKSLKDVNVADALEMYKVNALGPALVAKHFLPLMTTAAAAASGKRLASVDSGRDAETESPFSYPVIASISARVGSIGDNRIGGWYNYRASKAALNQLTKTMAVNLAGRKIICVALHPGTVRTRFSEPHLHGYDPEKIFTPEKSAGLLVDVLQSLTEKDSGKYLDYAGKPIAW